MHGFHGFKTFIRSLDREISCGLVIGLILALTGCGSVPEPVQAPRGRAAPAGPGYMAPRTPAPAPPGVRPAPSAASAWGREADRWMGTPYRYGGSDRRGTDCSGFALQLQQRVAGVRLPRSTGDQYRIGRPVARRDLRPGDLVFFNTSGRGVSHVGVMVGGDRFAHASTSRGVIYSRLAEEYWNRRFLGARRP